MRCGVGDDVLTGLVLGMFPGRLPDSEPALVTKAVAPSMGGLYVVFPIGIVTYCSLAFPLE